MPQPCTRSRILLICVSAVVLLLAGCVTATAVSTFCASAATTLASAKPIFSDMKASCLRELDAREPIGSYIVIIASGWASGWLKSPLRKQR